MDSVRLKVLILACCSISIVLPGLEASAQCNDQSQSKRVSFESPELDAKQFMHACYKIDAVLEPESAPLNFVTSRYQWDQPGGPGEPITVSYSYSNLLDGRIRGLTFQQLRQATEEAFAI